MEAEKVINLIEKIEKPVKVGAYTTYSLKKKSKSSRGGTIVNAPAGVGRNKIDSIYKDFEELRTKTVGDLQKPLKAYVVIK